MEIQNNPIHEIKRKLAEARDLEATIEEREKEVKVLKLLATELREDVLPALMLDLGITSFREEDGTVVSLKSTLMASIAKARAEEGFRHLAEIGGGALIKKNINIPLGDDPELDVSGIIRALEASLGLAPQLEEKVHPQSLSAFLRELESEGRPFDDKLLGVYRKQTVK